jgi:hypothetical protein
MENFCPGMFSGDKADAFAANPEKFSQIGNQSFVRFTFNRWSGNRNL